MIGTALRLVGEGPVQDRFARQELTHFLDLLSPYQNVSTDPENPDIVFDEERQEANKESIALLQEIYGEENVIGSSLNYDAERGQLTDYRGHIGIYVTTAAVSIVDAISDLDGLLCAEPDRPPSSTI